jgi:hypothetical protein
LEWVLQRSYEESSFCQPALAPERVPPNHEPLRGRAAIAEFYKGLRDVAGELEGGAETRRGRASGNLVSVVGKYSVYSGRVRFTSHELFKRQPDGSLKYVVDMYGNRDPQQ